MIMKKCKILLFLFGGTGLIMGCANEKKRELANPASQNCVKRGGVLKITQRGDGGAYGICIFADNRQCEEWALFRGNCPPTGIKITGFLTPQGIYCALLGGDVSENETQCQLPSGAKCSTQDLYEGKCPNLKNTN